MDAGRERAPRNSLAGPSGTGMSNKSQMNRTNGHALLNNTLIPGTTCYLYGNNPRLETPSTLDLSPANKQLMKDTIGRVDRIIADKRKKVVADAENAENTFEQGKVQTLQALINQRQNDILNYFDKGLVEEEDPLALQAAIPEETPKT